MATESLPFSTTVVAQRKRFLTGALLIALGLGMIWLFLPGSKPDQTATFGMNLIGSAAVKIPDLVVPVQTSLYLLTLLVVFVGAFHMARGIRSNNALFGVVALAFLAAFLIWATKGKSFSLIGMLSSSLVRATPIALAALCGVISERAAVVNIGIEGIMLISAQIAVVTATVTKNLWLGMLLGILAGALVAAFHAFLVIRFKVDQIVSGVAINIFATGTTSFVSSKYLQHQGDLLNNSGTFPILPVPLFSRIPIVGPILFENNIVVYLMLILVIVLHILLYYTPWGLRTRAVGEHPKAADTLGVNVFFVRYVNVILGGMIAGLGGVYFTLGSVGRFDELMTAGKGFIGLAAMISGNWNPIGAFLASLIFGFADSLQVKMQILATPIPWQFLAMAPYIATMIVLTGVIGRAVPPAADGQPYEKQ